MIRAIAKGLDRIGDVSLGLAIFFCLIGGICVAIEQLMKWLKNLL